jgi:hypothetical protein
MLRNLCENLKLAMHDVRLALLEGCAQRGVSFQRADDLLMQ